MATVLFLATHADDDTLSMGAAIRDHLNAMDASGNPVHDVHVLLLTTGQNSGVREELGLDIPTFVALRDDEFTRANRQNGVSTANLHIPAGRPADGALTVAQTQGMINDFLAVFPGAWVKAYSPLAIPPPAAQRHVDHVTTGQAVQGLLVDGVVSNVRYYVEPWLLTAFRAAWPSVSVSKESVADTTSVLRGYAEYRRVDLPARMRGIGYQSVSVEFGENTPPVSWVHVPQVA